MKQQTKHTPGPWSVEAVGTRNPAMPEVLRIGTHQPENRYAIAELFETGSYTELTANARLIAAAPEMLEALELVSIWANGQKKISGDFAVVIHQLREAIAKATGGAE